MTSEQQEFWNLLKFDAQYFAHICGKEMQGLSENKTNQLACDYLSLAMEHLATSDLASVIKTWLNYYHLPLDPFKLGDTFDKFHANHGQWIVKNCANIKVIGCQ